MKCLAPIEDLSKKALLNRLRRVCEVKKRTSKCKVTMELNGLWRKMDETSRLKLARVLAAENFVVDPLISLGTCSFSYLLFQNGLDVIWRSI